MMCSYNRINGIYGCESNETIAHDLRGIMGFQGWIMSDWTATKSTVNSVKAGLDVEMPYGIFYREAALKEALEKGEITESDDIDPSILRVLTSMYEVGLVDNPVVGSPMANVTSEEHNSLARKIAADSTVLLKNLNSFLPLDVASMKGGDCIAVFGDEITVSGKGLLLSLVSLGIFFSLSLCLCVCCRKW
jgi:beta-glucosidase